jgi:hypothetical protein
VKLVLSKGEKRMSRGRIPVGLVTEIYVESQPKGMCAVYLVETQNESETQTLTDLFGDFAPGLESLQLSSGKLVSYAVQLRNHDQSLLDQVGDFLKKNFEFVILHRSFDPMIYEIVRELCRDSGSQLLHVPKCDICGKTDPFPETVIRLLGPQATNLATRTYCGTCTAESAARSNKEFVMALLEADRGGLGVFRHMDLVRTRSSKKRVAFRIKSDPALHFAAK